MKRSLQLFTLANDTLWTLLVPVFAFILGHRMALGDFMYCEIAALAIGLCQLAVWASGFQSAKRVRVLEGALASAVALIVDIAGQPGAKPAQEKQP